MNVFDTSKGAFGEAVNCKILLDPALRIFALHTLILFSQSVMLDGNLEIALIFYGKADFYSYSRAVPYSMF